MDEDVLLAYGLLEPVNMEVRSLRRPREALSLLGGAPAKWLGLSRLDPEIGGAAETLGGATPNGMAPLAEKPQALGSSMNGKIDMTRYL